MSRETSHRMNDEARHRHLDEMLELVSEAALGSLVGYLGHELNQPLNAIRIAAFNARQSLKNGTDALGDAEARLNRIDEQVVRAADIIRGFVGVATNRGTDITGTIAMLLTALEPRLARRGLAVAMKGEPAIDSTRMARLVIAVCLWMISTAETDLDQSHRTGDIRDLALELSTQRPTGAVNIVLRLADASLVPNPTDDISGPLVGLIRDLGGSLRGAPGHYVASIPALE